MKTELKALSAAMLLALGSNAYAADIDLFTTNQALLTVTTVGGSDQSTVDTAGADILGQERDLYVEILGTSPTPPAFPSTSVGVGGSQLQFNNASGTNGFAQVQWDGDDSNATKGTAGGVIGGINPNGLGGVDLTNGGTVNAFLIETIESDLGYQFAVTIFEKDDDLNNDNNSWVRVTFNASAVVDDGTPVQSIISFAGFAQPFGFPCPISNPADGVAKIECSDNGIDLTKVGAIVVDLNSGGATTAIDLRLANVTTVPEPSMIGLMGIGLLAAGCANRGRGRKATCAA